MCCVYIGIHKHHVTNFKKNDLYFTSFHGGPNQPIYTYSTGPETIGRNYIMASDPSLDRSFQQFEANVNAHDQYINAQDQYINDQDEYIANVDRAYGGPGYIQIIHIPIHVYPNPAQPQIPLHTVNRYP